MHTHEGDDILLGTFRQLGIDFGKPREINFYFLFPTELNADNASRSLAQRKLATQKHQIDAPWWKRLFTKPQWSLSVTRTMSLDQMKIKQMTTLFAQVASANNGEYDGWEASVMGDDIDASRLDQFTS